MTLLESVIDDFDMERRHRPVLEEDLRTKAIVSRNRLIIPPKIHNALWERFPWCWVTRFRHHTSSTVIIPSY
jgi:hypothetical protein